MSDPDSKPVVSAGGMQLTPKSVIVIVISVVSLIFVFSNRGDVTLSWLWLSVNAPAWLMLLLLLAAGFLVGFYMGRNRYKRK